ncbi:response regulator transcription factor [Ruminiclostridium cellulolyticum]|uniref:Stage 0 sporulation protein A homolog n=1 Tax=Ruminiclostridium cellulolyticum (strain ATCC 35319 / DSM 5812 / JCM 6584 / H10) TaxID=394503 RepID=B8I505_RUMCH|nr:response regulator [Ruminiclostridium cellulolyticum]ACL74585.1 two component transcriptional regulator, AraC family [Ruminiclostridium cellulolyticum H10]
MTDNPLKVMIVDDESNTRDLLKLLIDWDGLGMEAAGDATSGLEALDMLDELNPDIVITDIQMPYMDGLTLSKNIKERHPDISIIILTAHDEFAYAQNAVSLGASDFILKPVNKDTIFETLSKVGNSIRSTRERLGRLELSHQYMQSNIMVFQNKVLNDLVLNRNFTFQPHELKMMEIRFDTDYNLYQVSLINVGIEKNRYTNLERQMLLENCCNYIRDFYFKKGLAYVFTDIQSNIVLLNNDSSISLSDISEHASLYFREQFSVSVSCGIGLEVHALDNVYKSYHQALNALNMCYITGEEITYADSQASEAENDTAFDRSFLTDNMKLAIKSGATSQALEITRKVLYNYTRENINDLDAVKIFSINMCNYIKELLSEMKIPFTGTLSLSGDFLLDIFKLEKYVDIEVTILGIVEKATDLITEALNNKSKSIVDEVKNYIDRNYSDNSLTLKVVADKFYINSSYLSRIFKKGTGITFSEYLTKVRIDNAKSILKSQDYKAYQLAEMIGIPDPNYFVKCFKKVAGISFAEYKLQKA